MTDATRDALYGTFALATALLVLLVLAYAIRECVR